MQITENISLRPYNTFGVDVRCRFFAEVFTEEALVSLVTSLDKEHKPFFILGGGSNLLFTKDYEGTVIRVSVRGITIVGETEDEVFVNSKAGENWDEFVAGAVKKGWGGLENLSLIPGNVGTGPVQNIGAYGVEIKDVIHLVDVWDREECQLRKFSRQECEFEYRDSIFKKNKNRYIILSVTFRLSRNPLLNLEYGDIRTELKREGVESPTIQSVRDAVCAIRRRKLPDPVRIGNSGSFFKNPVIDTGLFSSLKERFPGIVSFPQPGGVKLAAAWLIDQCGWKGYRQGDAGVHPDQPLVLVNYGNATGKEILDLAHKIQSDVVAKFGIRLETEVNIL